MYKLGSINNNHYSSNNMNNSSDALKAPHSLTPPIYQVPASECTQCGKFKVLINHTQYVLNGREAKEGQREQECREGEGKREYVKCRY